MSLLKLSSISKKVNNDFVLCGINFSQRKYQKIVLAGETGSGKSTLLKIIAGLAQPDEGEVRFENSIVKGPAETLVPGHPHIAYLSQDFELPKSLRVEQILSHENLLPDHEAEALYKTCRIIHLLSRRTDQLSGGERQRIALAKLLISMPRLLLLDEPFSNLDMVLKETLKSVLQDVMESLRITCILVSHDPLDSLSWADKIIVMREGKILQEGTPEKIYQRPVNEYVAGLLGKYNVIPAGKAKLFSAWSRHLPARKNIMIRPESLKLVRSRRKAVAGKILRLNFFGSYSEVEVSLPGIIMTVRSESKNLKVGGRVYVTCVSTGAWPLK
jgi:ABC-type sugar transport system ATPase subunit